MAWDALWRTAVLVPSAAATVGAFIALRALGVDEGVLSLPLARLVMFAAVIGAWYWVGLSVSMTALRIMRDGGRQPFRLVPLARAAQAAVVSAALVLPVAAGLLLVVPGVLLALRWSQTTLVIADERASWFEAAEESAVLAHGRRLHILAIWLIIGVVMAIIGWTNGILVGLAEQLGASSAALGGLTLLGWVVADAFGLVVVAAIYAEIESGESRLR